jgi:beta-glucosidase
LTGELNPSGRLPVTFYESVNQLPPFTDYSMRGRTYRYFAGKPLYPFGFGLSYSDFEYSRLEVGNAGVKVSVTNRSHRDGDEVVQVYTTPLDTSGGMIRQLVGFQRVHLQAGEARSLNFSIPDWNGVAKVSVGGGQPLSEWTEGHFVEHRF